MGNCVYVLDLMPSVSRDHVNTKRDLLICTTTSMSALRDYLGSMSLN